MSIFKSPEDMNIDELKVVGLWENPATPAHRMIPYLSRLSKLKLNGYIDDPRSHNLWVLKNKLPNKNIRVKISQLNNKFINDYNKLSVKEPTCPIYEYDFFLLSENFNILNGIKIQKTCYVFWTGDLPTLESEMKKHNMYSFINKIGNLYFINNVLYKDNVNV